MDRARVLLAAAMVLLSLALYTCAAWSLVGRLGVVSGRFEPGGVRETFSVDLGVIYAGFSKTGNGSAVVVVPEDTVAILYGRPYIYYINSTGEPEEPPRPPEPRPPGKNSTEPFNYTVIVYVDGSYAGSFNQDTNLTIELGKGEHKLDFIITVHAPTNITQPASFTLEIWVSTS